MAAAGGVSLQLAAVLVVLMPRCHLSRGDVAVLEHEVTTEQAKKEIQFVHPQQEKVPGCAECTYWERFYCVSHKVLDDHCCCDMRYAEWFLYVPHQCYLEEELCTTHAANCEEYMRIRMCCCDLHTALRWKYLFSGQGRSSSSSWLLFVVLQLLAALLAPS